MPRAFIALPLPPEVKEELSSLAAALGLKKLGYRVVSPEAMHLTLRFLGEVDEELFARLSQSLKVDFKPPRPFTLKLKGAGGFPLTRCARVAWAGLGGDLVCLGQLHRLLSAHLLSLGLPAEPKPFKPHLTLGRLRPGIRPADLSGDFSPGPDFEGREFAADEVVLFESILHPKGAEHIARTTIKLV